MPSIVVTAPLIEISLFNILQRYCTYGQVTFNGHTWQKLDTNQPIVRGGSGGVKVATIEMPDTQLSLSRAIVEMGIDKVFGANTPVRIYDGMDVSSGVVAFARLVFKGYVDVVTTGSLITVQLRAVNYFNDFFPKLTVKRPEFKFLIEDGTTERFGGTIYTFETRS